MDCSQNFVLPFLLLVCTAVSILSFQKGGYFFLLTLGIVSVAAFRIAELTSLLMDLTFPDVKSMSMSSLSDVALNSSQGAFLKFHCVLCGNFLLYGVEMVIIIGR